MVLVERLKKTIIIPEGIQLEINNQDYTFRAAKGETKRKLFSPNITITREGNKLILQPNVKKPSKTEKTIINTFKAHINNLLKGASEGFIYKLKICSGHFPMAVALEKEQVVIKNFLGEKIPRKADIISGVAVRIDGDNIDVEGADLERVSQTAANIERATIVRGRDRRRFQDGIYITEKAGSKI